LWRTGSPDLHFYDLVVPPAPTCNASPLGHVGPHATTRAGDGAAASPPPRSWPGRWPSRQRRPRLQRRSSACQFSVALHTSQPQGCLLRERPRPRFDPLAAQGAVSAREERAQAQPVHRWACRRVRQVGRTDEGAGWRRPTLSALWGCQERGFRPAMTIRHRCLPRRAARRGAENARCSSGRAGDVGCCERSSPIARPHVLVECLIGQR